MHKLFLVVIFLSGLSGCIKLQMPDDLISDTVDALRGSDDEPAKDDAENTNTFSHSVVGALDSPVADLKKRCLTELESRTVDLLGTDNSTFTVVSEVVSVRGDNVVASCTVSIE